LNPFAETQRLIDCSTTIDGRLQLIAVLPLFLFLIYE